MTGSYLKIPLLSVKILKQTQLPTQKEKCLFLILQYFLPCSNATHSSNFFGYIFSARSYSPPLYFKLLLWKKQEF